MNVPVLDHLAGFAENQPLGDASLPSSPVQLNVPPGSSPINVPSPANPAASLGCFTVGVGAATSIAVINSDCDPDPVGFFDFASDSTSGGATDLPLVESPADYSPEQAYVVISGVSVSGKISGSFAIGAPATLGLDGSAALDASVCTAFPRATPARTAATTACQNFRTIFSLSDLLPPPASAVPPGYDWQILSFGVQTELDASLQLTWASLASSIADAVNATLSVAGPLAFKASASATITASAAITDGYRVFARRTAGGVTFSVRKALSTSLGLDGGLGLTVNITDPSVDSLVNSVVEQVTGATEGVLQPLLLAAQAGALSAMQQQTLHEIATKLGVASTAAGDWSAVNARLVALKDDLVSRLAVTAKAQFAYAWKRVTTRSLVARFTVPDAALPAYHADILALNLDRLLGAPASAGIVFDRFLGRTACTLDVGCGFSFGVGSYVILKSWDSLQTKFIELDARRPDGSVLRQFSFLGKRGYDANWLGAVQSNYVELDASTPAPLVAPVFADFALGFSVAFTWKNQRLGGVLAAVADHGAVLEVFPTDDVDAAVAQLVAAGVPPDATGDAVVSLTIGDRLLRQLLPTLAGPDYAARLAPNAMARALPYAAGYPERTRVDRRMQVYGQICADFLAAEELSENAIQQICTAELANAPGAAVTPNLLDGEGSPASAWSVARVWQMASMEDLQEAMRQQGPGCFALLQQTTASFSELLTECVGTFSPLAAQSYGSRVFASLLVLAAAVTPGALGRLPRTVQLTWMDGGVRRIVTQRAGAT